MRASAWPASTSGSARLSALGAAARSQPRPLFLLRATPDEAAPPPPDAGKKPATKTAKAAKAAKPVGSRGRKSTAVGTTWSGDGSGEVDALGQDRVTALGKAQDYNINVTHGQNLAHLDSLYVGNTLG